MGKISLTKNRRKLKKKQEKIRQIKVVKIT